MYEELAKQLKEAAKVKCGVRVSLEKELVEQSADAIEEINDLHEQIESLKSIVKRQSDIIMAKDTDLQRAIDACPRWISVDERLPDEFENVIVANKRGKQFDIDKAWWNGSHFDRCAKGLYHNVTHWMPLPQPPQEANDGT